eukprot:6943535-Ditylum_brightwellii.AAC.1
MACIKGCTHHACKKGSYDSKRVIFCSNKTKLHGFLSNNKKDLKASSMRRQLNFKCNQWCLGGNKLDGFS